MPAPLTLTKLVRKTIRENTSRILYNFIATNRYEKCRTVKIYAANDAKMNMLEKKIDAALRAVGSTNHSFKRRPAPARWSAPAFIVRIPNEVE
jgi:hypothetical protein